MNGLASFIVFKDQHTRTFRIRRIVFHNHGCGYAVDDVGHSHIVCGEFFVPMSGDLHFAACDQRAYCVQSSAQLSDPFVIMPVMFILSS